MMMMSEADSPTGQKEGKMQGAENDDEVHSATASPDLGPAPSGCTASDFIPYPEVDAESDADDEQEEPIIVNPATQSTSNNFYNNIAALQGAGSSIAEYPKFSPSAPQLQSDTESTVSDIVSEAACYVSRRTDVSGAKALAIREKSKIVGVFDARPDDEDFLCAHCVRPNIEEYRGFVVTFICCPRRSHYACLRNNPIADALGSGLYTQGDAGIEVSVPCLSCLRPERLIPHKRRLEMYHNYYSDQPPERSGSGGTASKLLKLFQRRKTATATADEADSGPDLTGFTMKQLIVKHGMSLEDIVEHFNLCRIDEDDEEDGPIWEGLAFDKELLLSPLISERDALCYMRRFAVHPYKLRWLFGITLGDLCIESESEQKTIRSYMNSRLHEATAIICKKYGLITPTKLAILGFDLHHMLQMGFEKSHFFRFPAFSLHDWINVLGFVKPHWRLLGFTREDVTPGGAFHAHARGWNLENIFTQWKLNPADMEQMGLLNVQQLIDCCNTIDRSARAPRPKTLGPQQYYRRQDVEIVDGDHDDDDVYAYEEENIYNDEFVHDHDDARNDRIAPRRIGKAPRGAPIIMPYRHRRKPILSEAHREAKARIDIQNAYGLYLP